jgi:hypothetical protein
MLINNPLGWKIFVNAFSLKNTIGDLMKIPHTVAPGQLSCLHGIRVGSILWMMLGHAYMFESSWPIVNYVSYNLSASRLTTIFDTNFFTKISNLVHSAIFLSTTLERVPLSRHFFPSGRTVDLLRPLDGSEKGQEIQHFKVLCIQIRQASLIMQMAMFMIVMHLLFNRITAPYAIVVWFVSTVIVFAGHGPMWHFAIVMPYQICQAYWWASFLYITNYFFDSVSLSFLVVFCHRKLNIYELCNLLDSGVATVA